ncbi:MAG: methyltransferase, partial [Rhodospirillaceae bacterium]|nr:methyltransferase [Rhodospirillaceae bacterium]
MNSATTNKPELTRDLFLGEKLILWQDAEGYRAGIDPILLAAFNMPKRSERILDLGCGVG